MSFVNHHPGIGRLTPTHHRNHSGERSNMKRRRIFTGMTAIFAVLLMAGPVLAALSTVSGHAYGEYVSVTPLGLANVTSGPLPSTGELPSSGGSIGPISAVSSCVGVPLAGCNILSTGTLVVNTNGTTGPTGTVHSDATVQTVNALSGLVTATAVSSQCDVDSNGATSGSSSLTNLQINGTTAASNPGPNTQVVLLDAAGLVIGYVILNEQTYDSDANELTVNAVHIYLTGGSLGTGDIIIAQSQCDALPGGPAPVIPESPLAIFLPLMMVAILGGGTFLAWRRNQVALS